MSNPQQPELRRSGQDAADQDSAKTHLQAQGDQPDEGPRPGPVPEDQRPGHHPEKEQDKPEGPPG